MKNYSFTDLKQFNSFSLVKNRLKQCWNFWYLNWYWELLLKPAPHPKCFKYFLLLTKLDGWQQNQYSSHMLGNTVCFINLGKLNLLMLMILDPCQYSQLPQLVKKWSLFQLQSIVTQKRVIPRHYFKSVFIL